MMFFNPQAKRRLIQILKNVKEIEDAYPILDFYGVNTPSVQHELETAKILFNQNDPTQKNHAQKFYETIIREIENTHLKNHNPHQANSGSYQSTHNQQPYPLIGKISQDGISGMEDMANTQNQWAPSGYSTEQAVKVINEMVKRKFALFEQTYVLPIVNEVKRREKTFDSMKGPMRQISNEIKELENKVKEMRRIKESIVYAQQREQSRAIQETIMAEQTNSMHGMSINTKPFQRFMNWNNTKTTLTQKEIAAAEMVNMDNILNQQKGHKVATTEVLSSDVIS